MKNEMYMADCPKCGLTYKGNAKYFRYDLKEKCFDGITELVDFRIAGEQKPDKEIAKLVSDTLAKIQIDSKKKIADEIEKFIATRDSK
jgi:hypothetical protein